MDLNMDILLLNDKQEYFSGFKSQQHLETDRGDVQWWEGQDLHGPRVLLCSFTGIIWQVSVVFKVGVANAINQLGLEGRHF